MLSQFMGLCRPRLIEGLELDDSAYEYAYETISISCSGSDEEVEGDAADVDASGWKARSSQVFALRRSITASIPMRGSLLLTKHIMPEIKDTKSTTNFALSLEEIALSEETLAKRAHRVAKEKLRNSIFHCGTFDTVKFKAVSYQKAKIMLDLNKNPPHADNGGQPFKVNMDKTNLLANSNSELATHARCCMYKMSFLKSHWLAICLDPDSLAGSEEKQVVASARNKTLQRELKCENSEDVINDVFCIHLSTLYGHSTDDKICILQHLLNRRLYACAALNYTFPDGRSVEKNETEEVGEDIPWFDMVSDICELSAAVRSPNEAALGSFVHQINSRAPKRRAQKKVVASKITSPRNIDPDIVKSTPAPKAQAKSKAGAKSR